MAGDTDRVGQQRREPLPPAVDRDVIDLDTSLGQQLLDIAVGKAIPQIPAHRHNDHLGREPETRESRPRNGCRTPASRELTDPSSRSVIDEFNRAATPDLAVPAGGSSARTGT